MSDVIVTTMNDLPGYRVAEVYGEVFGLTVRSQAHRVRHRREPEGARSVAR